MTKHEFMRRVAQLGAGVPSRLRLERELDRTHPGDPNSARLSHTGMWMLKYGIPLLHRQDSSRVSIGFFVALFLKMPMTYGRMRSSLLTWLTLFLQDFLPTPKLRRPGSGRHYEAARLAIVRLMADMESYSDFSTARDRLLTSNAAASYMVKIEKLASFQEFIKNEELVVEKSSLDSIQHRFEGLLKRFNFDERKHENAVTWLREELDRVLSFQDLCHVLTMATETPDQTNGCDEHPDVAED